MQELIDELPAPQALAGLRRLGVSFIVYHRTLELPWEKGSYEKLVENPELDVVAASSEVTIFRWASAAQEVE